MSKNKNKDFHDNEEVKNVLHVESKILDTNNIMDQLPISSVVKINNPGEEIKITIDNITNIGENKSELLPDVVEEMNKIQPKLSDEKVIISIIDNKSDKKDNSLDKFRDEFNNSESDYKIISHKKIESDFNPLEELKKGFSKISIVDVSKKKSDNKKSSFNPIRSVMKKASAMAPVSMENIEGKAFESLIYIGGGMIAAASIASKTIAGVSSSLIKK